MSRRRRSIVALSESSGRPNVGEAPQLAIVGKHWQNRGAHYVPRWVSCLSALMPDRAEAHWGAFFEWAQRTGFNGLRVFAGELIWVGRAPQSAIDARKRLPRFLDMATAAGLAVEVTAITGSASGAYDPESHVREIAVIVRGRSNVVLELANEVGHPTQASNITPDVLRGWGERYCDGILWAIGAAQVDEAAEPSLYPTNGGRYNTAHLDRGRDLWNRARRVRELYAINAINNEANGADELAGALTGRQRSNDPAEFAVYGALDRGFPGVGGVHHSQAGLHAELPGPVQQACADAYVAAHRAVDDALGGQQGDYRNSSHAGSPVGVFSDHDWANNIVRQYSFVAGNRAASVQIGVRPGVRVPWVDGWRESRAIYEMTAADGRMLRVLEATR